jgi:hypothetical protein
VRGENSETAARGGLGRVRTMFLLFKPLEFLFYIGGCRNLIDFLLFVLNLSVALG